MPYEIPQKLQYEEKIIFGLTFKQLVYALFLILPALLIFLKANLNIFTRLTIAVTLVGIAFLFMFFDFLTYLKNFMAWIGFREAWLMEPKMIQFVGIEKIDKGVVYVWKTKKPVKKQ